MSPDTALKLVFTVALCLIPIYMGVRMWLFEKAHRRKMKRYEEAWKILDGGQEKNNGL